MPHGSGCQVGQSWARAVLTGRLVGLGGKKLLRRVCTLLPSGLSCNMASRTPAQLTLPPPPAHCRTDFVAMLRGTSGWLKRNLEAASKMLCDGKLAQPGAESAQPGGVAHSTSAGPGLLSTGSCTLSGSSQLLSSG